MVSRSVTFAYAVLGCAIAVASTPWTQVATGAPNHLVVMRSAQPDYPGWLRASGVRVIVRVKAALRTDGSVESARPNGVTVAKSNNLGSEEKA
jgi:hypothetical protein